MFWQTKKAKEKQIREYALVKLVSLYKEGCVLLREWPEDARLWREQKVNYAVWINEVVQESEKISYLWSFSIEHPLTKSPYTGSRCSVPPVLYLQLLRLNEFLEQFGKSIKL